jgi:hypothetical protein
VIELPPPSPGIGRDKDIVTLSLSFEFGAESARVFSILGDEGQWPAELPVRILKRQPNTKLVVALPDFTRAEIAIEPTAAGCKVALVHDLIKTAEGKSEYREIWIDWFQQIEKRVSL